MIVQFTITSLLLLNLFLGERGFHFTITFSRHPVIWSIFTGVFSTFWFYLACVLFHEQVPALNNIYNYVSRPSDTNHVEIVLFVGASFILLYYFVRGWIACCFEECNSQTTGLAGHESSTTILRIVPSRPGEIGKSVKCLVLTVCALCCIICGLDIYRSQAMITKWIKLTGVVKSIEHSTDWDAKYGRHNYITVETAYQHENKKFINTLYFRDGEIPAALKRYSVSTPVVLLCNPQDLQQSEVEQERNITVRSSSEKQLIGTLLVVMMLVWLIPNRLFDLGMNGKLAGDYVFRQASK
jgi:hypothetical protein